jgi:hypothetical protein
MAGKRPSERDVPRWVLFMRFAERDCIALTRHVLSQKQHNGMKMS